MAEYSKDISSFSKAVSRTEWLLFIIVAIYISLHEAPVYRYQDISLALASFGIFTFLANYTAFFDEYSSWKMVLRIAILTIFITWSSAATGCIESSLIPLYLLPVIISALSLSKKASLCIIGFIFLCYLWLSFLEFGASFVSFQHVHYVIRYFSPILILSLLTVVLADNIQKTRREVRVLSETDGLTGCLNRRAFITHLERERQRALRYRKTFTLIMIDCDQLKYVNDQFGHKAGDELIQMTARLIKKSLRKVDIFARYGGDEFMVLATETNANAAGALAERIRTIIADTPFLWGATSIKTTVSIGISHFSDDKEDVDQLIQYADAAMYQSKVHGRDRVSVYTEE